MSEFEKEKTLCPKKHPYFGSFSVFLSFLGFTHRFSSSNGSMLFSKIILFFWKISL